MHIRQASQISKQKSQKHDSVIAFNNNGQIMVTSEGSDIKQWQFNNNVKQLRRLKNHNDIITCIIFSKMINWFASGDKSGQIICWTEKQSYRTDEQHYYKITHLLLNNNEDELISCGEDKKIKLWKVNFPTIKYQYDFDRNYTDFTKGITMNISENYLVITCHLRKIILWKKIKQWKYQCEIYNQHLQQGIYFISDSLLIWQYQKEITSKLISELIIFQILEINSNDDNFIIRTDLQCNLKTDIYLTHWHHFLYNTQKKFILQTYDRHLFCLKQQNNDEFKLLGSPINCISPVSYGVIRQDGQFFVAFFPTNIGCKVYKII